MKHTPGKWEPNDSCPWIVTVRDKENVEQHIAWCYEEHEEHLANARLIAAAPEMLAVLEKLYALSVSPTDVFGKVLNQDYYIDVDELGALIAKARGEEIPSPVFKSIADLEISESDEAKGEKQ